MAMDSTPWFIDGGARHSAAIARTLAYAATTGAEGIVSPGDLKVVQKSPTSAAVQVLPGAGLVLNRGNGGAQQTYVARNATATDVAVPANTNAAGGATQYHIVALRIEDPNVSQTTTWPAATDPLTYAYAKLVLLSSGITATTERPSQVTAVNGQSLIFLARIAVPAGQGAVTDSMITNLRTMALPRSSSVLLSWGPTTAAQAQLMTTTSHPSGSFTQWLSSASAGPITVPLWATHVSLIAHIAGAGTTFADVDGSLRARFANVVGGPLIIDISGNTAGMRHPLVVTASGQITTGQGTVQNVIIDGALSVGQLGTNPGTHIAFDVRFYESAV